MLYVNRMGFNFTVRELAPVLLRLIRSGALQRTRNAYGQFLYFQE